MLMKKLQGKNKQYFDSGDYNMAKNKPKLCVPNPIAEKTPTPGSQLNIYLVWKLRHFVKFKSCPFLKLFL